MTQPHDAATPLDEQCPPLKVLEFAKRTVLIYPPPAQLWAELNELDSIVGQGESWPLISRKSVIDKSVSFHAQWSHHVLETVIGHCARISMSGPLDETLRIFVAILGSWDTNYAWVARRKGFVGVLVLELARSWDRLMKLISLALDPHPEVAGRMQAWGEESARRALATKRKTLEVVPAAAVNLVRVAEETRGGTGDSQPTAVVPTASDLFVSEATPATPSPTHTEPAPPGKSKGVPKEETEVRVREWLSCHSKENPRDINRDALAKAIGVGAGSVSKSTVWIAFAERRKAESKPVPREVPLTNTMLANIPANSDSDAIAELIKQQAEDAASDERRQGKKSPVTSAVTTRHDGRIAIPI